MRKKVFPSSPVVTLPGLATVAISQPAQAIQSWEHPFDKEL